MCESLPLKAGTPLLGQHPLIEYELTEDGLSRHCSRRYCCCCITALLHLVVGSRVQLHARGISHSMPKMPSVGLSHAHNRARRSFDPMQYSTTRRMLDDTAALYCARKRMLLQKERPVVALMEHRSKQDFTAMELYGYVMLKYGHLINFLFEGLLESIKHPVVFTIRATLSTLATAFRRQSSPLPQCRTNRRTYQRPCQSSCIYGMSSTGLEQPSCAGSAVVACLSKCVRSQGSHVSYQKRG